MPTPKFMISDASMPFYVCSVFWRGWRWGLNSIPRCVQYKYFRVFGIKSTEENEVYADYDIAYRKCLYLNLLAAQ